MWKNIFTLASCALLAVGTLAEAAEIKRVVLGAHDTYTRVVFHLDAPASVTQSWGSSGQPIVTLPEVTASGPKPSFSPLHAPAVGLTYRASEDGLQAVILTDGPVKAKSFALPPDSYGGHRVVVDISRRLPMEPTGSVDAARTQLQSAAPTQQIETPELVFSKQGEQPSARPVAQLAPTERLGPNVQSVARTRATTAQTDVCSGTASQLQTERWDMRALINHGACLSEVGRLVDARGVFERILSFDPEFHHARLLLADIYRRQGEIALAKDAYEYVLMTAPPADVTKRIQMALRELRPRAANSTPLQ